MEMEEVWLFRPKKAAGLKQNWPILQAHRIRGKQLC